MKKLFIIAHALLSFPAYSMEDFEAYRIEDDNSAVKYAKALKEQQIEQQKLQKLNSTHVKNLKDLSQVIATLDAIGNTAESQRLAKHLQILTGNLDEAYFATLNAQYQQERSIVRGNINLIQKRIDAAKKSL